MACQPARLPRARMGRRRRRRRPAAARQPGERPLTARRGEGRRAAAQSAGSRLGGRHRLRREV